MKRYAYRIYQLSEEKESDYAFLSSRILEMKYGNAYEHIEPNSFDLVYEGQIKKYDDFPDALDYLFYMFQAGNRLFPSDFQGHSLSVGDVISLTIDCDNKIFFVDDIGFRDITEIAKAKGFDVVQTLSVHGKKKYFLEEVDGRLNTVRDYVAALLKVPQDYTLNPLGESCYLSLDHYNKCVVLESDSDIDTYEETVKEEIEENGDSAFLDIPEDLKTFEFYYVFESRDFDDEGIYLYFSTLESAKKHYNNSNAEAKNYGIAEFRDNQLVPCKALSII